MTVNALGRERVPAVALLEQCSWQRSVSFIHSISAGGSTGTVDTCALHEADGSVAEEQSPRLVRFCASCHLASPLPAN